MAPNPLKVPPVPLNKQGSINKRPNRARGYSLSVLNQKEYVRETFGTLPPPPFPPPGLGYNKAPAPKQTNGLSDKQPSSSDIQKTTVESLTLHSSPGTPRDSKVDVDLENEEHLDYYLNSETAQCDGSTSTGARTLPIPIQCEKSDGPEGLLPPRSSSLPRKLETGSTNPHRPLPLDISGITLGDDDALDSSKGLRFPPTLKRLGSEQNLYGEFAPETPKSAALKPPTPKFPPPEAIRPFDIKKSDDEESNKVEHHIGDEDSEDQASLLSNTKTVFHRQPPPPLSVITYRPSVSPPATSTQVLRDRPGANGGSIQLASASTLKAENAQRQKGSLAAEHFSARSSILAPNFRRKMSLPVGLGSSNMMRSAVQNTNSSLMPKALNGSPSTLSADPSPTGSYFINPIRRPCKGLTLFDIVLEEPQEGASLLEQSPQKLELQPFWLMRCFERSMVSGGFISNKMYIPRSLWYQSGARLSAIEAKISACELITATLYNMALSLGQNIPPTSTTPATHFKELDIVILLKELESFDTVLYSVQNNLAKKLSFIESIKKSQSSFLSLGNRITKSLERMTTSRDKIDDVSLYIDVLIKLFQTCQILDHWIKQFHAMSPGELQAQALTRLARVSDFMNTVICAFVMRDLTVLMAKYMKRCKEWLID
ncbi:hypothetical protein K7432_012504 [Basidiobolus ranarum]|uniref:Uncharacterized protein n=1 Tax=Basidiobolus ranarum TaxID=34480 RepID=A0ABR2VS62_9FUNG